MIYTTCRYAPIELFKGFNEEHKILEVKVKNFSCAENYVHPNLCSYAKAVIETVLKENIKELVLTDCCDAVRRSYDVLQESNQLDFIFLLSLPHKNTEADYRRFAKSLEKLVKEYSHYKKKEINYDLVMQEIGKNIATKKYIPETNFIRLAGAHGGEALKKEIKTVFHDIEVVDDTCTGNRHLSLTVDSNRFYEKYAKSLLNQEAPCMRMWFNGERTTVHTKPAGTIYHTIKFCDFYSFDYYQEKKNNQVKMLKIETESIPQSSGQLLTRLEAFKEELGMDKSLNTIKNGFVLGIDIGSTSTDLVVMSASKEILASLSLLQVLVLII